MKTLYRLTILSLIVLSATTSSYSQRCKVYGLHTEDFESMPWYGNNQYLTDFLTARGFYGGSNTRANCPETRYQLPVRIVIFRNDANDPNSAINITEARDYLGIANQIFEDAGTGIRFYVADHEYIPDGQAHREIADLLDFNDDPNFLSSVELFLREKQEGFINLYFVRNSIDGATGTAATPISSVIPAEMTRSLWSCWVRTNDNPNGGRRNPDAIGHTLAHELGHVLGNAHTHHPGNMYSMARNGFDGDNAEVGPCHQEVVSRTQKVKDGGGNCLYNREKLKSEVNGDALRDTPADPNCSAERADGVVLSTVNGDCQYSSFDPDYHVDNNNAHWDPPVRNIMSYSHDDCTNEFSDMQIGVMWNRIEKRFMEYFVGNFSVSRNVICTYGTTVTLNNPPPGANISWSASPSGLINAGTLSGSGTSAFIKAKDSNVSGWATVTFHQENSCEFFNTSKSIRVGKPFFDSGHISGPSTLYIGSSGLYTSPSAHHYSYYRWHFPSGGLRVNSGQGTTTARLEPTGTSTGLKVAELRAYNDCGYTYKYIYIDIKGSSSGGGGGGSEPCANSLLVSPNPTNGDIIAQVIPPGGGGGGGVDPCLASVITDENVFDANSVEKDGSIVIMNHIGETVYDKKHRGKKINLKLDKLNSGIYMIYYLYNDEELLSEKFIKQ